MGSALASPFDACGRLLVTSDGTGVTGSKVVRIDYCGIEPTSASAPADAPANILVESPMESPVTPPASGARLSCVLSMRAGILVSILLMYSTVAAGFTIPWKDHPACPTKLRSRRLRASLGQPSGMSTVCSVTKIIDRIDAQSLVDNKLLLKSQYGKRMDLGRDAQGLDHDIGAVIMPDDLRLSKTYGEFPLTSFDMLVDASLKFLPLINRDRNFKMVDVGSGCGRIVMYAALTRANGNVPWECHGVEIFRLLHDQAVSAISSTPAQNYFGANAVQDPLNRIALHHGPAEDYQLLFGESDLLFCYSTAWTTSIFMPELGTLVLADDWSQMLAKACRPGCVAITTDRALNPNHGWKLMHRVDVPNREVFGSTGYIHVLLCPVQ